MHEIEQTQRVTVVGAGLVGSLLSMYLARRGFQVDVLEWRPDMRREEIGAGRSINLAISARGLDALKQVGLEDEALRHAIPMRGRMIHPVSGETLAEQERAFIYPAVQYVLPEERRWEAIDHIRDELKERVAQLRAADKILEAERLQARCRYDLEMLEQTGFCSGIENYSRHLDGRAPGSRPWTLMDYFQYAAKEAGTEWLMLVDESHVTIPQMRAMWHGDRNRKTTLVEHGFRLPSALDNRPMTFDEIESLWPQVIFVSATPADYELEKSEGEVVEQVIRPTGLLDPVIEIRPAQRQVPDLIEEVKRRVAAGQRSLITTLTKRLAEDLATIKPAAIHQGEGINH